MKQEESLLKHQSCIGSDTARSSATHLLFFHELRKVGVCHLFAKFTFLQQRQHMETVGVSAKAIPVVGVLVVVGF